jgi:O-antigen/teichoic acid export membrane protein
VRRTFLLTVWSDLLPKLTAFVALVLVARKLGAADFAYLAVALGWIGYAWWAVDLGQAGYAIRALATRSGKDQQRVGSEIFSLYLALAGVVSGGLVILLLLTGASGSRDGRLLLAMSPYLVAYALFPDWWLRARGDLLALAVANWASVGGLLVGWALVPSGDAVAYALVYGLSPLCGALVALLALARAGALPRWIPSWNAWLGHVRTSVMFGVAGAGGQISQPLALATMAATGDPRAAGAFALGLRASAAAANALWLVLQNALPRLLSRKHLITVLVVTAAALPPLVGLGIAALLWHPVLAPALGGSYATAGRYGALGLMLLVVWGPKYVVEIGLIASFGDSQRIVMNALPPVLVVAAAISGLGGLAAWVMPVVLLAGEGLAAAVGYLLLRKRIFSPEPEELPRAQVVGS